MSFSAIERRSGQYLRREDTSSLEGTLLGIFEPRFLVHRVAREKSTILQLDIRRQTCKILDDRILQSSRSLSTYIFLSSWNNFIRAISSLLGFLTAMRQEVTRAHKGWALDNVTLHNEVTRNMADEVRTPPSVRIS